MAATIGEAPWEAGVAEADGVRIAWEAIGAGPPLLLVMGIGAQLTLWPDGLCRSLAAQGYRVIRYDNRDAGKSSWMTHLGLPPLAPILVRALAGRTAKAPYTLNDMADDAIRLLDALGHPRAHIVGASMGGMIAQTIAIRHPSRVLSLTSMMSAPGPTWLLGAKPKAVWVLAGKKPKNRDDAAQRIVDLYRVIGNKHQPFDEARFRAYGYAAYDRAFHPEGLARQLRAVLASGSRAPALKLLQIPTLVIHGADDPLVPVRGGRDTAALIPGAKLHILDRMAHDLPEHHWPRLVALIVENIGRASPST
jgi:pimeloyl-ACP methyl ester carboxylesterase